ncbi:MAG: hypothetical protein WC465_01995 [Patescibacteria group bacterium]
MDPKIIADIPTSIIACIIILGVLGIIQIHPFIIFSAWVLMSASMVFQCSADIMSGGYKNDWHRNEMAGDKWREGSIATIFLFGLVLAIPIASIMWKRVESTSMQLLLGTILVCLVLSYLNVRWRYKIFKKFTPEEKEKSIRLRDLSKYLRWYHWIIFLITLLFLRSYIFP